MIAIRFLIVIHILIADIIVIDAKKLISAVLNSRRHIQNRAVFALINTEQGLPPSCPTTRQRNI